MTAARCPACPVPAGRPCHAELTGLPHWCRRLAARPDFAPAVVAASAALEARPRPPRPPAEAPPPDDPAAPRWRPGDGFAALPSMPARPDSGRGLVTAITASRDRPHLIGRALASSLSQGPRLALHVVVLNDRYDPEAYRRALLPFAGDPRLAVLGAPTVRGIPRSQQVAWPRVATEYAAVLDDDDEWRPGFLDALAGALDARPELAFAYCDLVMERDGVEALHRHGVAGREYEALLERPWLAHCAALWRAACTPEGFDPHAGGCTDYDLWLRCAAVGPAAHVPEGLAVHHWHGRNHSGDPAVQGPGCRYVRAKVAAGAYPRAGATAPPPAPDAARPTPRPDPLRARAELALACEYRLGPAETPDGRVAVPCGCRQVLACGLARGHRWPDPRLVLDADCRQCVARR